MPTVFIISVNVIISICLFALVLTKFKVELHWPVCLNTQAASISNVASGSGFASVVVCGGPQEHPSAEHLQISL